jgi:uncharacterized protein YkwD
VRSVLVVLLTIFLPFVGNGPTYEEQTIKLINKERTSRGIPAVAEHPALMVAAEKHTQYMADSGNVSHYGPYGSTPWERAGREGYDWSWFGEIIGAGYTTPESKVQGWMNSPPHRAILLDSRYEDIGVGYVYVETGWKHYWTADFGRD